MRSRIAAAFAGSLVTIALVGGVTLATGTGFADGGGSTIYGCVKSSDGQLRVVGSALDCKAKEQPIQWNQQGPQGEQGPQGPAGPSVTFVQRPQTGTIAAHEWQSVESFCLAGEVVTGGGYSLGSIGFNDKVNVNGPVTEGGLDGWIVSVHNDTDFDVFLGVVAICAQYPPVP